MPWQVIEFPVAYIWKIGYQRMHRLFTYTKAPIVNQITIHVVQVIEFWKSL